ncbi:hypothetical protein, partial [Paenibacillus sp. 23TSA30-6]|uniref:hypothetical protein n=1 Tax=Paenibacillus sp. 23TSA30-6 TaxID=2546104 RepID=UPI001EE36F78
SRHEGCFQWFRVPSTGVVPRIFCSSASPPKFFLYRELKDEIRLGQGTSKKIDSSVILKVNYGKHILVSKAILTWEVS